MNNYIEENCWPQLTVAVPNIIITPNISIIAANNYSLDHNNSLSDSGD